MNKRDWKERPPETLEEAKQFSKGICDDACVAMERIFGERPKVVERDGGYEIVWDAQ